MNATTAPRRIRLDLKGSEIGANGKLIVLASSDPKAENSLEQPTHLAPVEKPLASSASGFEVALDPQSFTVLRARYAAGNR